MPFGPEAFRNRRHNSPRRALIRSSAHVAAADRRGRLWSLQPSFLSPPVIRAFCVPNAATGPNPLAPFCDGAITDSGPAGWDLLFALRSGGLQFTLSLEGLGAPRQGTVSTVPQKPQQRSASAAEGFALFLRRWGLQLVLRQRRSPTSSSPSKASNNHESRMGRRRIVGRAFKLDSRSDEGRSPGYATEKTNRVPEGRLIPCDFAPQHM